VQFFPLKAPNEVPINYPNYFKELRYPLLMSPKIDGFRGGAHKGTMLSKSSKPFRSYQVHEELTAIDFSDGEIVEGNATDSDVCNRTNSHLMSFKKPGDLFYYIFDTWNPACAHFPFEQRLALVHGQVATLNNPQYIALDHSFVNNEDELLEAESKFIQLGYEGVMLRDPRGTYKPARSTWNEGIVLKLKRFVDTEALVVGIYERMHNDNAQTRDEQGYAFRSSSKTNLKPTGIAGGFIVDFNGTREEVPGGKFTLPELTWIFQNQEKVIGKKYLKFKYMQHGMKDKLRHKSALGFRDPLDM